MVPPCRAFTPKLVDFYKQFKSQHPNFELIFVNHDESGDAMLEYMKTDAMPWPAVRFDDIESVKANKYCGAGIPDLVLVDADGKVLSDSFNGQEYVGPEKVMDDIKSLVHALTFCFVWLPVVEPVGDSTGNSNRFKDDTGRVVPRWNPSGIRSLLMGIPVVSPRRAQPPATIVKSLRDFKTTENDFRKGFLQDCGSILITQGRRWRVNPRL